MDEEIIVVLGEVPCSSKRQKRTENFDGQQKRQLIEAVKSRPRLWDLNDALHSNKNAIEQAWFQIAV